MTPTPAIALGHIPEELLIDARPDKKSAYYKCTKCAMEGRYYEYASKGSGSGPIFEKKCPFRPPPVEEKPYKDKAYKITL